MLKVNFLRLSHSLSDSLISIATDKIPHKSEDCIKNANIIKSGTVT